MSVMLDGQIRGGDYSTNFFHTIIFSVLHNHQNNGYLSNFVFIFDRGHYRVTSVAPVKQQCDSNALILVQNQNCI